MIVKIHSTNPELASLLRKNPATSNGIQFRELKNGVAIGRFLSPNEYHLVFQDTKYSYCEDHSSQIDYQSYCNPRVFLSLANLFLRHLMSEKEDYLTQEIPWLNSTIKEVEGDSFETIISVPNVYADGHNLSRGFVLNKYFSGVSLERREGNLHTLTVRADSVFSAVNLAALAMMYLAASNKQPWFINNDIAKKYIRVMKNLKPVPYFVLYLFARRCLPTQEMFRTFVSELEDCSDQQINLEFGNTQSQRIHAVREILVGENGIPDRVILEIGCGEMDYPRAFLRHMPEGATWVSSDVTDYSNLANRLNERYKNHNLVFTNDLTKNWPAGEGTMLAVEVIEHMPYNDALDLMINNIDHHAPDRVVITTPNITFNQNYEIYGFRHDDHHFELTSEEFELFILRVTETIRDDNHNYEPKYFGIGDQVDGEFMSLGCILTKVN